MESVQMNKMMAYRGLAAILAAAFSAGSPALAQLNSGQPQILSTGQLITPLAPRGSSFQSLNPGLADNPEYTAGQAVQTALSPDKKTLGQIADDASDDRFAELEELLPKLPEVERIIGMRLALLPGAKDKETWAALQPIILGAGKLREPLKNSPSRM
jgi:hypothetical protein